MIPYYHLRHVVYYLLPQLVSSAVNADFAQEGIRVSEMVVHKGSFSLLPCAYDCRRRLRTPLLFAGGAHRKPTAALPVARGVER